MTAQTKPSPPDPQSIMQIGLGFWPSKVLLAAVRFELFTFLAATPKLSATKIKSAMKWNCGERYVFDFLDTLAAFNFLERDGLLEKAKYSNSADTAFFLDKKKPSYIGGILEMANNRLYEFWGNLEEGLLTGKPQNEVKTTGHSMFEGLYESQDRLKEFVKAMSGIQAGNFMMFARKFDFSKYHQLVDVGGSGGLLSITVAQHQPHMSCINFDLGAVENVAKTNIQNAGLSDRVKVVSGDFFKDAFPRADVIVMGNILHDWKEETKLMLMTKACEALPPGGAFVAIENVIDNERKKNVFGMMMSLNMLIETGEGFDYTVSDFEGWAKSIGFSSTEMMPLAGPSTAAIAYK